LDPGNQELKIRAEALIGRQSTMTLATSDGSDPWAAPVYYAYHGRGFYFFSDPASRHIRESRASGRAASAIFASADTWQDILGLQMSGAVETVTGRLNALAAVGAYLKKFPFTREFFSPGDLLDPAAFSKRFNVRLYRFRPSVVFYMDNSIRFGFREQVEL
jgi:uncharacterized protein YhbP (UPF0306 family)